MNIFLSLMFFFSPPFLFCRSDSVFLNKVEPEVNPEAVQVNMLFYHISLRARGNELGEFGKGHLPISDVVCWSSQLPYVG